MTDRDIALVVLVMAILMAIFGLLIAATDSEPTCDLYGHVPIMIDDTLHCVPWENVPDLGDYLLEGE